MSTLIQNRSVLWPSIIVGALLALGSATAVFAATPSVSYTATGSTPGSTLTLSGAGFKPGETVMLSFGLSSATAVADSAGAFSGASLTIPNVPSSLYYVIAVGQTSGSVAFNSIWVNSFFPTAGPSSWYITPGSTITWTGGGFSPNEPITVRDSITHALLASFTADANGSFSAAGPMVVPLSARNGTVSYTLHGGNTGINLTYVLAVADLYPYAAPSSWYATPGTSITFSGSGFGPNESVSLMLGTSTSALATATADSTGAFTMLGPVNLPYGSTANYRIAGGTSGASASVPVTLAGFYPTISPSSYYSNPGGIITLTGSGFAANEPVVVTIGGVPTTTTTNGTGGFVINNVQAPATPNTPATISGVGQLSGASTSFTMAIGQYYPSITPSLWYSFPGDSITFNGSGFAPNEVVTVSGAGSGTVITDSLGNFTGYSATLPTSNATFNFTGNKSITTFPLTIALGERFSAIWFDVYWANGGTALKIFGAGYGSNETVNITYGASNTSLTNVTADASGNFTANTTIPYVAAGDLTIKARGSTTHSLSSATLTVAPVWTDFHLDSYAVPAGSAVHLIGSGYLPNETINLTTDRTGSTVVTSFSTDSYGNFDATYTLPADAAEGNMMLTATGTHSFDTKSVTFWVQH